MICFAATNLAAKFELCFTLKLTIMEENFEEMQHAVMTRSQAYINSSAFSRAMDYVADNDWDLYKELIELEYNEAFG